METFETLKRLVAEIEPDMQKAAAGNRAAGTRVRKIMQQIKAAAQEIRTKLLESRDADDTQAPPAAPTQA